MAQACQRWKKGLSGDEGDGCLERRGVFGYNYLAFDVIGDLAFESPFDMLKVANDAIPAGKSQANPMAAYGNREAEVDVEYFPTVQILYEHGPSCAITYHLALNPSKLQAEPDQALGNEDDRIASSEIVKRLSYLEVVIKEALRLHSTSSLGLPCIVPEGGLNVSGKFFPEGSVLSVSSHTIHREPGIWGEDEEAFRPEE
ncbi:cytochrome P450 [Thelephora terrestris]|uniref:Cytochrome P450 n=1 Tax=Thelephora terrestris TaxID=56493 RepID=A0A9P6H973_9AGAM|nr:cytochrome P450 [Thelephora terrestris]